MSSIEWAVGMRLTSARLNSNMIRTFSAVANGDVAAGSTDTQIPNISIAITTLADNVEWSATGVADFDGNGSGSVSIARAFLKIDGVTQTGEIIGQAVSASANFRGTYPQLWNGTLATPGTYTFTMTATVPSGGIQTQDIHSRLRIQTIGHVSA